MLSYDTDPRWMLSIRVQERVPFRGCIDRGDLVVCQKGRLFFDTVSMDVHLCNCMVISDVAPQQRNIAISLRHRQPRPETTRTTRVHLESRRDGFP